MRADDRRHGTPAGYQTHFREDEKPCIECRRAHRRQDKLHMLRRIEGVQNIFSAEEVAAVVLPWTSMGVAPTSIARAAGVGHGRVATALRVGDPVRRSTFLALVAVTEDQLPGGAKVFGDLTKRRVLSLMAAGHMLRDMPINPCGQWRYRDRVLVEEARTMREFFRAHEFEMGPSAFTAARAQNSGFVPPLGWDDPDTLAWPGGVVEPWPAAWRRTEATPPTRAEVLAELGVEGVDIWQACARLKVTRSALARWCERNGENDVFARLMRRAAAGAA